RHDFPLDGEYVIRIALAGNNRFPDQHQIEVSVDGERVQLLTVGGDALAGAGAGRGGRYAAGGGAPVQPPAPAPDDPAAQPAPTQGAPRPARRPAAPPKDL